MFDVNNITIFHLIKPFRLLNTVKITQKIGGKQIYVKTSDTNYNNIFGCYNGSQLEKALVSCIKV